MSNYGISPHIAVPKEGVWFKSTARPVETYSANNYNRKPNNSYNPTAARIAWRQERGPFKAFMAEEIKDQQAAATLKQIHNEKTAAEALASMSNSKKGGKRTRRYRHSRRRRTVRRRL